MTRIQWVERATELFGRDSNEWKFKCPSCGHVARIIDWRDAGAPDGALAFSCIGRFTGSRKEIFNKTGGPCNYAGGGLFQLNPVSVIDEDGCEHKVFDFAV